MKTPFALFKHQIKREACFYIRQLRLIINSSLFFLMVMVFFPLTMPPESALLRIITPGLIWIAVLLSMMMSAERMFLQDYEDGVLEQWIVSGYPLSLMITAKLFIHWVAILLPFLFFSPFLALLFGLNFFETHILILSLITGSLVILLLCALAAAFSTGVTQKNMLMALILLPLTIPVMIFGSGVLSAAMQGLPTNGYLALLTAMSLLAGCSLPFAIAGVLKISLGD